MPYPDFPASKVVAMGEALYAQEIRDSVEAECHGQFLVLDVATGAYAVDPDDLIATRRLLDRHPGAVIYGLRVGHPTAYRIGAAPT